MDLRWGCRTDWQSGCLGVGYLIHFDTQMAEPEESATFDDMGTVHRPLEAVANARAQSGGETMTGKGLTQSGKTA